MSVSFSMHDVHPKRRFSKFIISLYVDVLMLFLRHYDDFIKANTPLKKFIPGQIKVTTHKLHNLMAPIT